MRVRLRRATPQLLLVLMHTERGKLSSLTHQRGCQLRSFD